MAIPNKDKLYIYTLIQNHTNGKKGMLTQLTVITKVRWKVSNMAVNCKPTYFSQRDFLTCQRFLPAQGNSLFQTPR